MDPAPVGENGVVKEPPDLRRDHRESVAQEQTGLQTEQKEPRNSFAKPKDKIGVE